MSPVLADGSTVMGQANSHVLHKFKLPSNKQLVIKGGGVADQNGDAPTGLELKVINNTTNTVEETISDTTKQYSPAATVGQGGDKIVVKIENQTGKRKDVTGFLRSELR